MPVIASPPALPSHSRRLFATVLALALAACAERRRRASFPYRAAGGGQGRRHDLHRHRRGDRRLLPRGRRDLPDGQQEPQPARHDLRHREHRGLDRQPRGVARRRVRPRASSRATGSSMPMRAMARSRPRARYRDLRAVLSLHSEPFTVVARADSRDRARRRPQGQAGQHRQPGSGQRATTEAVMAANGWTMADFAVASELPAEEQAAALASGRVDAIVFTVGHPSSEIYDAAELTQRGSSRSPVRRSTACSPSIPILRQRRFPGGFYRGNDGAIPTFGVRATLVTTADTPDEVVYLVVKSVFEKSRGVRAPAPGARPARPARDGARGADRPAPSRRRTLLPRGRADVIHEDDASIGFTRSRPRRAIEVVQV